MINRKVFHKDPGKNSIANDGVAEVSDQNTLRFELQTFVCEGEYKQAIDGILSSYLGHLDQTNQPAVWLSGFFGSGKSHVAKMLAALWTDHAFEDGARARGLAELPSDTRDLLKELSAREKTHGKLHVAMGKMLGRNADDPGMAVLEIILESCGLPNAFHSASAYRWLDEEGLLEKVRASLQKKGKSLDSVWPNMFVNSDFGAAIAEHYPGLGSTSREVLKALQAQFPRQVKINRDQFRDLVTWALRERDSYRMTAIVLDEVQQYLGGSDDRIAGMQWVTEDLCKFLKGRVILIGTGQSSMTMDLFGGKLTDRFTQRFILKETDVKRVVRRVVLQKAETAAPAIKAKLEECAGEIDSHLTGTRIGPQPSDAADYVADYPLLPARQRFWSAVLRATDPTETKGRVRGMLRVVYQSLLDVLDQPLGTVIPGDAIYRHKAPDLLQFKLITQRLSTDIEAYCADPEPTVRLKGRILSLVFLIHQLPRETELDTSIRATQDHIADLLVSNLEAGSAPLRQQVQQALRELLESAELMLVDGEYSLQTSESQEWETTFQKQRSRLDKTEYLAPERKKRIEKLVNDAIGRPRATQGAAKLSRTAAVTFGSTGGDPLKSIQIFVRSEWDESSNDILHDIRSRGIHSAGITVVLPRETSENLRTNIVNFLAAQKAIEMRGLHAPNEEVVKIRRNFEHRRDHADETIDHILSEEMLGGAVVYLDGGDTVSRNTLAESVQEAANLAAKRLYGRFRDADFPTTLWRMVLDRAKKHDDKPLKPLGYDGDILRHPVVQELLSHISHSPAKRGSAIISHFGDAPFGWEDEAVVAGLAVLLKDRHVRAIGHGGTAVEPQDLDRKSVLGVAFEAETVTLTTGERLKLKGMLQTLVGIQCKSNELEIYANDAVAKLQQLARDAGGDPPLPAVTTPPKLKALSERSGADLLKAILDAEHDLKADIERWNVRIRRRSERLPRWDRLCQLHRHAVGFEIGEHVGQAIDAIQENRSLVDDEEDPTAKLIAALAEVLRPRLTKLHGAVDEAINTGMTHLQAAKPWQKISSEQRCELTRRHQLTPPLAITVGTDEELLHELDNRNLADWQNLLDAVARRFQSATADAARLIEPKVQFVTLDGGLLKSPDDVESWLSQTRDKLLEQIKDGPVHIR